MVGVEWLRQGFQFPAGQFGFTVNENLYESDYLDMLPEQESKLPPKDDAFYDKVFVRCV